MPANLIGRWMAGVVGLGLLIWAVLGLRRGDGGVRLGRWFALGLGLVVLGMAVFPGLAGRFHRLPAMTRVRWLIAAVSLGVMIINVEAIRHHRLHERYALLWIFTSLLILAGAASTRWLDRVSEALGMQYVSIIVTAIFVFLLALAFQFSIEISRLRDDCTRLAQRMAVLEARRDIITRSGQPVAREAVAKGIPGDPTCGNTDSRRRE